MLATLLRKLELTAENAAMDSTGMEQTTRSEYDDMQSGGRRKQYVKAVAGDSVRRVDAVCVGDQPWSVQRQDRSRHIVDSRGGTDSAARPLCESSPMPSIDSLSWNP